MQNKANLPDTQMNITSVITMNYEQLTMNYANKNKPNSKPICQRAKLMQSVYLQRIMKKNADRGYEKTKPKQTQYKPKTNPIQTQFFQKSVYFSVLNFTFSSFPS
ncbi:hypothetical protein ES703_77214 [subsurface metagenome]